MLRDSAANVERDLEPRSRIENLARRDGPVDAIIARTVPRLGGKQLEKGNRGGSEALQPTLSSPNRFSPD